MKSKEFKIDTWWKKLLIYTAMIGAALNLIGMFFLVGFVFGATVGLFDWDDLEEDKLTEEEADELCNDSCVLDNADGYEIIEYIDGDFLCGCYNEEGELTNTLSLGLE